MKVCPFEKNVSVGGHHDSDSFFFIATGSRTLSGPAATAYQPFVVDRTVGAANSEPKRLARPMASSTF